MAIVGVIGVGSARTVTHILQVRVPGTKDNSKQHEAEIPVSTTACATPNYSSFYHGIETLTRLAASLLHCGNLHIRRSLTCNTNKRTRQHQPAMSLR